MPETDMEKTETATPRRRQEARQDGNVARSTDLVAASALLAAVLLFYVLGAGMFASLRSMTASLLSDSHVYDARQIGDLNKLFGYIVSVVLRSVGPILIGIALVAALSSLVQVGFLITGKPLQPSLNKLSVIKGVKRLFDMRAAMRLVMSLGKIIAIVILSVVVISNDLPKAVKLAELEVVSAFGAASNLVFWLALKIAILLFVLAVIDYVYQRSQHEKDLRMSKQEVKDEMKRMEGDPMIKQRRSRVARQLALQRMSAAVPQADVIVTNPTHFAIALKYDSTTMKAPKVVAKGADFMAMRIRQIATANGIPLVERKELARALYRNVEVGQEIPPEFYGAVAEILAYVYRISERKIA